LCYGYETRTQRLTTRRKKDNAPEWSYYAADKAEDWRSYAG